MSAYSVIDADGHIIENNQEVRRRMEPPYDRWSGAISHTEPWDTRLFGTLPEGRFPEAPTAEDWLKIMDQHNIEVSYLFPTHMLSASTVKDPRLAIRLCRAYNDYAYEEYTKTSQRLKPLALISNQEPVEGARELNRAVTQFGYPGGFLATTGLRFPLGHRYFDPIYEEANRLGCVIAVHGARNHPHELAAGLFETFSEVHLVGFAVGVLAQFSNMINEAIPDRFPNLRLAFLEIGCTWLPYWLDRMDEHWKKRGAVESPNLKRLPSECVRERSVFFSIESGETLLPETIKYLGDGHFVYATDIPHWDCEFPENLEAIEQRGDLSVEVKRKILYSNAKLLYNR
jgi:predicted TIM-barrel fold metal-dependent hydrolase